MARRAAQAASDRRKRIREAGTSLAAEDVDGEALAMLDRALESIASNSPGFGGAMVFRGPDALPLVSLIPSREAEGMRRLLINTAVSTRKQMDHLAGDSIGSYLDSVTSTARGAIIAKLFGDDLLVVCLEGPRVSVLDTWKAMSDCTREISGACASLFIEPIVLD